MSRQSFQINLAITYVRRQRMQSKDNETNDTHISAAERTIHENGDTFGYSLPTFPRIK